MSNAAELTPVLIQAAHELENALVELEQLSKDWAEAERIYREAKARAYLVAEGTTVAEKEAQMEPKINMLRYERDMKEGLKVAALESVRSRRTQVSAIQTLAGLSREEAAMAKIGP